MFCQNCGANNPENAAFCARCGAPLNSAPQMNMQQNNHNPNMYEQPQQGQWHPDIFMPPPQMMPQPVKKKKTGLIVGIIIAAVVMIAGIAVALILLLGGDSAEKEYNENVELADTLLESGNYASAIFHYESAIEIDPTKADVYQKLSDLYREIDDLDTAKEVVLEGIENADDARSLWRQLDLIEEEIKNQQHVDPFDVILETESETEADIPKETFIDETKAPEIEVSVEEEEWKDITYSCGAVFDAFVIVPGEDDITVYPEDLSNGVIYNCADEGYICDAFSNGDFVYFGVSGEYDQLIKKLDLRTGDVSVIADFEEYIDIGGIRNGFMYFTLATEEYWYDPAMYRMDLATGDLHGYGVTGRTINYVGSDFMVTLEHRTDVSPTSIDVMALDGSGCVRISEHAHTFEVRGRTIYYNEMVGGEYDWFPWVMKSYNVDTGEYQTLSDVMHIPAFKLLPDGNGAIGFSMGEDGMMREGVYAVSFLSGEEGEFAPVYQIGGTIYIIDEDIYIAVGEDLYQINDGNVKHLYQVAEDEFICEVIRLKDGSLYIAASRNYEDFYFYPVE